MVHCGMSGYYNNKSDKILNVHLTERVRLNHKYPICTKYIFYGLMPPSYSNIVYSVLHYTSSLTGQI